MQVTEVKEVRWPNELLEYCQLQTPKERTGVGYVVTKKNELPKCRPIKPVTSYLELQELVSRLAALNGRYVPFLRGQGDQYFLEDTGDSPKDARYGSDVWKTHSLKPGIWRLNEEDRRMAIEKLLVTSDVLCSKISSSKSYEQAIKDSLKANPLAAWAIIQHYGDVLNCYTPMLDLTRSLHVACHFAMEKKGGGYIYVLGFPWPAERFSTSIEDGLVMASLLGVTPCAARRPLAQDGYLACTSDYWKILAREDDSVIKEMEGQFHRRILAVIQISDSGSFWMGSPFNPNDSQYEPAEDMFRDFLANTVATEAEYRLRATRITM